MSSPTVSSRRPSADGVDVLLAKVGIVAAVLLLGLQLFASQPFLLVIPLSIGTGCGLYLLTRRDREEQTAWLTIGQPVAGYLPAVILGGLAVLVIAIRLIGARTMPVYLLTGAIGVVIFAQILFVDDEAIAPGAILFEILAVAVVLRLSALFVTPGFVGVDIWTHATVSVDGIASQGSLAPLAGTKYSMAPIYHAIGATGALLFGSARVGIYLTLGVLVPLAAVFVYSTGKLLVPARWALLGTALYAFADQFIRWGIHIIPTSLGLVFFLAVVYLVARIFTADAEPWAVGLAVLGSLAVVFTHQVSTAILLVFLAIAAVVSTGLWLANEDGRNTHAMRKAAAMVGLFVVTLVTTIVSWAVTPFSESGTFLWRELGVLGAALLEDAGFLNLAGDGAGAAGGAGGGAFAWLIPYVELFGFALLLAAAVLGGLLLVRRSLRPDLALTMVLAGGVMFVLTFGLSLFGIRALLPGRWLAFLYVPLALLAAAGLFQLSRSSSRTLVAVAVVVLAIGYPTTMVVSEKATLDNPAFGNEHARYAHTQPEISAVETISTIRPAAEYETLHTDHPYDELFVVLGGYEEGTLTIGPEGPVGTEATVAREYQSAGPSRIERTDEMTAGAIDIEAAVCPDSWNTVFANDDVRLCTAGATGGGA